MTRRDSVRDRRECFERNRRTDEHGRIVLDCEICGGIILPASEKWEAEHTIPLHFGGTETKPVHPHCHKPKTAKDMGDIAKGKRVRDKTFGIARSKGSFRNSKWRRKVNGETVPR
jgi:hypothetical protein